jgi:4-hydroxy-tetrahydrodipicolinate synthase
MSSHPLSGVLAPVITPFKKDLSPDSDRLIAHCRWLLSQDCGLAVFGTNSEANSLSVNERKELLDALLEAGIDVSRMMPGTGCCALSDSIELTRHAVSSGCAGVLMLPPFYYKNISDEGLYRYFSELIEQVADDRLKIYLYHIPPIAAVGITPALVEKLLKKYPSTVAGMKDSSGDWSNTKLMLDSFAATGFDIFVGSETFLLENMRNGGAGCISATANVNPAAISQLFQGWQSPEAEENQRQLNVIRESFGKALMIPALKAVVAHYLKDPNWKTLRPPLLQLKMTEEQQLIKQLDSVNFSMPGIR